MEGLTPEEIEQKRLADEAEAKRLTDEKAEEDEKAKKKEPKAPKIEQPKTPKVEEPKAEELKTAPNYAGLPADAMLAVKFEQEEIKDDEIGTGLETAKKLNLRYVTKGYWNNVEKADDGVTPRYLRAKLMGFAIAKKDKEGKTYYDGFLPFA